MKFSELLLLAIQRSEIPLRFEPGAGESVARPVTELLRVWLQSHRPDRPQGDFDYGKQALLDELMDELDDRREIRA